MNQAKAFVENIWYTDHPLGLLLLPVSWLYILFVKLRRWCYRSGVIAVKRLETPIIIVGNITVGGTGKTPLVIWLVEYFKAKGFRPGVIGRGYAGKPSKKPQQVQADSNPFTVGDEPVLIARNTGCPVAVSVQRQRAAAALIKHCGCNLILSDDGLQHYALGRDIEIAVIDGHRRFGNGYCLPAGPLRETISRLETVDFVIGKHIADGNEYRMDYVYRDLVSVCDQNRQLPIEAFRGKSVHAIAGICNPDHYFAYLSKHGLNIIVHKFADHHRYSTNDINFNDGLPVVMTEKDAVKCTDFADERHWYLPIRAALPRSFAGRLDALMKERING